MLLSTGQEPGVLRRRGTGAVAVLLLLIGVLFGPAAYAAAGAESVEARAVPRSDGSHVTYYLLEKASQAPSEVLLLVLQGSDCNSVLNNESILTGYRNVWPQADLLLVEKYGIDHSLVYSADPERADCPADYIQHDSPGQRLDDLQLVLKRVRQQGNYHHYVVLGGSEGAVIANLLSARVRFLSATVAFNGGGRFFIDDVLHSIAAEHDSADAAEGSLEEFRGFAAFVRNSEPVELNVSGHGFDWWQQMLSLDQLNVLRGVSSPVLLLQGGQDRSVAPAKVDELVAAVRQSGRTNVDYREYPTLDHRFLDAQGNSKLDSVVAYIHAWLEETLTGG